MNCSRKKCSNKTANLDSLFCEDCRKEFIERFENKNITWKQFDEFIVDKDEKNTLSDKEGSCGVCLNTYRGDHVKEAIKEFIDSFLTNYPQARIIAKAKKSFGSRLVE